MKHAHQSVEYRIRQSESQTVLSLYGIYSTNFLLFVLSRYLASEKLEKW